MSASGDKKIRFSANEATNYIEPEYFEPSKNTIKILITDLLLMNR